MIYIIDAVFEPSHLLHDKCNYLSFVGTPLVTISEHSFSKGPNGPFVPSEGTFSLVI